MKYISLFSGVGGFDLAFDRQGFTNVMSSEIDKYAQQTFQANFSHNLQGDITQIDAQDIPEHDVLVFGSPCQDYSVAGKRAGIEGFRGKLIYEPFRILASHKPKAFLFENVKGLLSIEGGKTFKFILKTFHELGYHTHYRVLNSKDFGVPQNRQRVFVVGFRDTQAWFNFSFPEPLGIKTTVKDILDGDVDEKYFISDKLIQGHLRRKETNKTNGKGFGASLITPEHEKTNTITSRYGKDGSEALIRVGVIGNGGQGERVYSTDGLSVTLSALGGGRGAKTGLYLVGTIGSGGQGNKIYDSNGVSCTLTADSGGLGRTSGLYQIEERVRKLTPRECFRLQGFPDSFVLPCSDSQSYRQAGNSVTVPVIEAIAKNMIEVI